MLDHVIGSGSDVELPGFQGCQRVWGPDQEELWKAALIRYTDNPRLLLSRCYWCRPGWRRWLPI
jgi:hypothetical protein